MSTTTTRQQRWSQLNRLTKPRLCDLYRELGYGWSATPLETWPKQDIISAIIDLETRRAAGQA